MILNFSKLWKSADFPMKKLLLNTYIDKIIYDSDTKSGRMKLFNSKKKRRSLM